MDTMIFRSGDAMEQFPKKLGLGKVLDGWNIYPAYHQVNTQTFPRNVLVMRFSVNGKLPQIFGQITNCPFTGDFLTRDLVRKFCISRVEMF